MLKKQNNLSLLFWKLEFISNFRFRASNFKSFNEV